MYNGFYISENVGNNSFAKEGRKGRRLYVAPLINGTINDLKIGKEIVFEECDEVGNIISFNGLENFIKTSFFGVPTYIFDNHNHAFYFWFEAIKSGIIKSGLKLIHIDEHSDLREPVKYLDKNFESYSREEIFEYTNYILNVGDYIKPAIKSGIIGDIIKIQGEQNLQEIEGKFDSLGEYILNLDIDFFSPGMSYIDFDYTKKIVINLTKNAKLITIATSPFFINQELAINTIKKLFI